MSDGIYAEPGLPKKVRFDQDNKENMVDIYVSAESLRVYDNPWVEDTSPNIPGPAGLRHPVSVVSENSEKRNSTRADLVFKCVLYLLLLAGIMALIYLGVQMKNDKTNWRSETKQLKADNANLKEISHQLTANYTELSEEINRLWRKFCGQRPRKCRSPDRPKPPTKKGAGNGWMGNR